MDPVRDKTSEMFTDSHASRVSNGMDFFKRHIQWFYSLVLALFFVGGYTFTLAPPSNFPSGNSIVIARGASVPDIAEELYDAHVIKHPAVLKFVLRISGASGRVQAGAYLFSAPENALVVAYRLSTGAYNLPPVRITFPEGVTVRDISRRVADAVPLISAQDFLSVGKPYEGYLFPDTYLFSSDATATSIVDTMRVNFDAKTALLVSGIQASGHSLSDVVTMASLVEKEARTDVNRRIVAGVLWNRLALGMPLQVDAVFGYIFDRDTYSPSFEDLKVDSPYNTYTHKGLPPGPISNPGLESIYAALYPTKTNYLYYLTGKDTLMHYARTYAEHVANQTK
ncbi:MAG: endolytic transglycosylase MltG, partial [Patescibacteria group bacterium]